MCLFYRTYCLLCNKIYKKCVYNECGDRKACRKKLFKFQPGYYYYEKCPKCEKLKEQSENNLKMYYVPF
jgi:hypothetical protein